MAFFVKGSNEILSQALSKLSAETPISSISPGSVARSLAEAITTQLADLYSVVDFNFSSNLITNASGTQLDVIGKLYGVSRKALSDIATFESTLGVFYFYLDSPIARDVLIPVNTLIYTNADTYIGRQFSYITTTNTIIPAGRTRSYASIRPQSVNSVFTAGPNTLTVLGPNFVQPTDTVVRCINPKGLVAQVGFESDDSLRNRIVNAIRTSAGGTLDAVRLSGLSVSGVRDITIRIAPYGMGSFDAVVVPEDNILTTQVVQAATLAMAAVKPVGVRMFVSTPDTLPISVRASIVISQGAAAADVAAITQRVNTSILRYLNTFLVGTQFIYNHMIQNILDTNDAISDVIVTSLSVNGNEILRQNYTPDSNQQIIPGEVVVVVASS